MSGVQTRRHESHITIHFLCRLSSPVVFVSGMLAYNAGFMCADKSVVFTNFRPLYHTPGVLVRLSAFSNIQTPATKSQNSGVLCVLFTLHPLHRVRYLHSRPLQAAVSRIVIVDRLEWHRQQTTSCHRIIDALQWQWLITATIYTVTVYTVQQTN